MRPAARRLHHWMGAPTGQSLGRSLPARTLAEQAPMPEEEW